MRSSRYVKLSPIALVAVALMAQPGVALLDSSDFSSLDFVASAPCSYDHSIGGGAFDDDTTNDDTVESLQGGDFACGDLVSYMVVIPYDASAPGPSSLLMTLRFSSDSTGQSGAGHVDIVNVGVNSGALPGGTCPGGEGPGQTDSGLIDLGTTATATLVNEIFDDDGDYATSEGGPFTNSDLIGQIQVDGIDPGDNIVVRVDVRIACDAGSSPTGNLQASLLDAISLPDLCAIQGGAQTINFQGAGDLLGAGEPLLSVDKTASTDGVCPGEDFVQVLQGETVTFCYCAENSGTDSAMNVQLIDDMATPGDLSDDEVIVLSGLTDQDGDGSEDDLAANSMACGTLDVVHNAEGTFTNVAKVTGDNGANGGQFEEYCLTDDATVQVDSLCSQTSQTLLPGATDNAQVFSSGDLPILGETWEGTIDTSAIGGVAILWGVSVLNLNQMDAGNFATGDWLFNPATVHTPYLSFGAGPILDISFDVPLIDGHCGEPWRIQALVLTNQGELVLTNGFSLIMGH